MRKDEKIAGVVLGLVLGPALVFVGALGLSELPQRADLKMARSSDVDTVRFLTERRKGRTLRQMYFITRDWGSLKVEEGDAGYKELSGALGDGLPYAIGFTQTRSSLSDSPTLYNKVYAIEVNGRSVESFESHVMVERILLAIGFAAGLAMAAYALQALWRLWSDRAPAGTPSPVRWSRRK
jgi:hypothetical protein